jgi:hypothetical protein
VALRSAVVLEVVAVVVRSAECDRLVLAQGEKVEHQDLTLAGRCLVAGPEDHLAFVQVQVLLYRVVGWDCQEPLARAHFSCHSLEVPNARTRPSIASALVGAGGHIEDQNWAAGSDHTADSVRVAYRPWSYLEQAARVPAVRLVNHSDRRNQYLLAAPWALEEHLRASHERHSCIDHADLAESDFGVLVVGSAEAEHRSR